MKRILLATVSIVSLAGPASAADYIPFSPIVAPAPMFSWTGCYIGGFIGGAWHPQSVRVSDLQGYNDLFETWSYDMDPSYIAGGTLGCDLHLVGSPFVLGLEGEIGYLSLSGTAYDPFLNTLYSATKIGDWYSTVTGRLGYAWDRTMVYVKVGAAFLDTDYTVYNAVLDPRFAATRGESVATWTVGSGIEWAFAWNWSLKAEYTFIALEWSRSACGFSPALAGSFCWDHDLNGLHTAKIGVNYRFGSAPAAAWD